MKNAYMLVYERIKTDTPPMKSSSLKSNGAVADTMGSFDVANTSVPSPIADHIIGHNRQFIRDCHLFSGRFGAFMLELLRNSVDSLVQGLPTSEIHLRIVKLFAL